MKLSELRAAIRKHKGNPSMTVLINGSPVDLILQKTSLIDVLGETFADHPEGRAVETFLSFEDGFITGFTEHTESHSNLDAPHDHTFDLDDDLDI